MTRGYPHCDALLSNGMLRNPYRMCIHSSVYLSKLNSRPIRPGSFCLGAGGLDHADGLIIDSAILLTAI